MSENGGTTLPKVGLTKRPPVLKFLGLGRAAHEAGIAAGTFPPPRIRSRKPGSPDLFDCAENWAVVEGNDWREVRSPSLQPDDAA